MECRHFGPGHFRLGRFGLDISATENAKGGHFSHNHKLWVGDGSIHVCMYACVIPYLGLSVYTFLLFTVLF